MTTAADILPGNAAPFELALAEAMTDTLPVPIREIMDPATTPVPFLPFLAAHESVDLWFGDWSEDRKRLMITQAMQLAALKGTSVAAEAFLDYVDTAIVHKRSYPSKFPVGRIAAGLTPIQHPTFTAHFLLKLALKAPKNAIVVGRTAVGSAAVMDVDREPIRRALHALVVSKAPETAYTATFAHRLPVTLDDGVDLDAGHIMGSFKDRTRL